MPSDIRGAVDCGNGQHHDVIHESTGTSPRDATTSDDNDGTESKSTELQAESFADNNDDKSAVVGLARQATGGVTEDVGTSATNNQHAETEDLAKGVVRQRNRLQNHNPTKIKLYNTENNSWKSLLRDVIVALVPLFVLFKISTHSSISNIGNVDPNKKLSQADVWEQLLYGLYLKKQQEGLQKEYMFLEAMNGERECHDYPTIDTSAKMKQSSMNNSRSRRQRKKGRGGQKSQQQRSVGQMKRTSSSPKRKIGKQNRPMARRPNDPSSPSTLMSSIAWAFRGGDSPGHIVNKGTENTAKQQRNNDQERDVEGGGGKKGNRRKVGGAKKKKMGW
eukprot:CAMPEP_0181082462 /NCGR_PEP_ID=MMETSP1071-20121207/3633_1 /TAXON_ID=35127 /ORGANISM="Thalassiosira sp., Strain NH16" /LENGTH=333 /DNA_ID=CAMNT_0023164047 /DNA_START=324 /DNA_END=1322 /DNA_ORIENTATION=-